MRIHQRLTAFTSCLASLVVGTSLFAQSTFGPQGFAGQPMGPAPTAPPPFQPAFSSNNPAALFPPGAPPHSYPFPDISPHLGANILQEQHYNRNGQWFNEIIHRHREYYGAAEAMTMYFDGPGDAYVGSAPARIRSDTLMFNNFARTFVGGRILAQPVGEGEAGNLPSNYLTIGPGAFPFPWIQINPTTEQVITDELSLFPIRTVNVLQDNPSSPGFKLRAGYFNDDGTGIGAEGWYAFENHDFFQAGQSHINGIPITQSLIAGTDLTDPAIIPTLPDDFDGGFNNGLMLINYLVGGLPLNDNSGVIDTIYPGAGFSGTTQKYDLMYRLDIASEAGSANVNLYLGNLLKRRSMRAVAFASARYIYLDEYFRFRGLDSGFGYDITLDDPPSFRPDDDVFGPVYPLLDSRLQSYTTSQMAGPELGVRVDLGRSKGFNLWMQGSAGLMVNYERLQVRGQNIGNAHFFNPNTTTGSTQVAPPLDMFSSDTRFNDIQQHTHVSPTFNFGVNAEMNVLGYLPILKFVPLISQAQLSLGYNFLFIGEVSRPADSINWRGYPQFPSVRSNRTNFEAHQLSAGLSFER